MSIEQCVKLGNRTAILSFLVGTAIFSLYISTSDFNLFGIGYIFVLIAGLVNLIIILILLFKISKEPASRNKLVKTCIFMLTNIPVLIFYCWFSFSLLDKMRIKFTNVTNSELKNIHFTGCDTISMDDLKPGESQSVWFDIPRDCSITVCYLINGKSVSESVVGYVCRGMGDRINYKIGEIKTK